MKKTKNWAADRYFQSLAVGLLGAATGFGIVGMPQEAQAATAYGYAYQEFTSFRFTGLDSSTIVDFANFRFAPQTTSGATVTGFPPASNSSSFDVSESVSGTPGIGNNSGFFSLTNQLPILSGFSSAKGETDPIYSRGDALVAGTPSDAALTTAFLGTGASFANVAESYVNAPLQQGNATGGVAIASTLFNLNAPTSINYTSNFRNELRYNLTGTGSLLPGSQVTASYTFNFVVNAVDLSGNTRNIYTTPVNPTLSRVNNNQATSVDDSTTQRRSSTQSGGPITDTFTLDPGVLIGNERFRIEFATQEIVDTRLTDVPEPITILGSGAALGFGGLLSKEYAKLKKKKKEKQGAKSA